MTRRLLMLWELDEDANRRDALKEAAARLDRIADQRGLLITTGRFTVVEPDSTVGSRRWHLLFEGSVTELDVSVEPFLPLDVVLRDQAADAEIGGRGHRRGPVSALRALRQRGVPDAEVAVQLGVSVRTVQRMWADLAAVPAGRTA